MVTFADMMALLLCLFVLLLSFSTMDAQRFQRIAGELEQAFGLSLKTKLLGVIETGGVSGRDHAASAKRYVADLPPTDTEGNALEEYFGLPSEPEEAPGERVAKFLESELSDEIRSGRVTVEPSADGVLIRFSSNFLFGSGNADIYNSMSDLMENLAAILAETDGEILVSGHTDDVPISTDVFRSNWDLSSARAASLVHMLLKSGKIDKKRIGATGYADSRPIASNDTEEGRARNRRVEIQLRTNAQSSDADEADDLDASENGLP